MPLAVKVGAVVAAAYVLFAWKRASDAKLPVSWALLHPLGDPLDEVNRRGGIGSGSGSTAIVLDLFGRNSNNRSKALTNAFGK